MVSIKRRSIFLVPLFSGLFLLSSLFCRSLGADEGTTSARKGVRKKPNIVFVLIDDLGWRDVRCFGSTFYDTPHIDRLAKEGMRFTQAYSAAAICTPSRAGILTGKTPSRLGITQYYYGRPTLGSNRKLRCPDYVRQLPKKETTMAEALKKAGYATWSVGKWHLGKKGSYPEDHGFDVNIAGCEFSTPPSYFSPYRNPKLTDGPVGEHLPERLSREATQLIETHQKTKKDQPFFLYFSMHSVHRPIQGRKDLIAKYQKRLATMTFPAPNIFRDKGAEVMRVQSKPTFAAMVEAMDEAVGTILTKLRQLKIEDNTIVVFISDHGGLSGKGRAETSNLPLRLGKHWLYEGGVRVPAIIRWPGVTKAGTTSSVPIIHMDLYPTFLQMAGLPLDPKQHVDGLSLVPLLKKGVAPKSRSFFWHWPHYGSSPPCSAVRQGDYKLLHFYEDSPEMELYNIRTDIGEQKNLAKQMPKKVLELKRELDRWMKSSGAKLPVANPKYRPGLPEITKPKRPKPRRPKPKRPKTKK